MRFFPGYEGCVLNLNETAGRPVCFASFTDHNSALRALRVVQDLRFDPNVAQPLRVEFAKTNSKTRRLPPEFYAEKRRKAPLAAAASPYFGGYNSFGAPEPWVNPNVLVPWFQNMNLNRGPGGAPTPAPYDMSNAYPQPFPVQPPPQSKVPPCSTLFVANLHPDVNDSNLNRLFRNLPGFKRLRLSNNKEVPICFVEFDSVPAATHAMNNLQGVPVGPTCMRIEYARTKMGETKHPRGDSQDEGQGTMDQIGGDNIGGN